MKQGRVAKNNLHHSQKKNLYPTLPFIRRFGPSNACAKRKHAEGGKKQRKKKPKGGMGEESPSSQTFPLLPIRFLNWAAAFFGA